MPRYIEGPEVKLTENDKIFVDAEFYTGEKFTELELHRMFPITGLTKYIALVDSEGEQIAIIRDLNDLMEDSRKVAEKVLEEYYMIPRITKFIKMSEKFKVCIIGVYFGKLPTFFNLWLKSCAILTIASYTAVSP